MTESACAKSDPMTAGMLRRIQLASVPAVIRHPSLPNLPTSPSTLMNTAPTTYAIRVDGHLDDHWSAWLGDLDIARNEDGTTTLTVSNADQAQLHGVLAGLRDIGAVITELRSADAPASARRSR